MSKHISERHIDDKILSSHPIPNNVKEMQKLDENIKELLSENKKSLTLNQEKNIERHPEKVISILYVHWQNFGVSWKQSKRFF